MFTTNAALNYHCKSKHNNVIDTDENKQTIVDDNDVIETKLQSPKRNNKRKIPKIVYVLPGKLESTTDKQPKKAKIENSNIEIQSITSVPIYVVD